MPLVIFSRRDDKWLVSFLLKCLVELTSKTIWVWCFLLWEIIIYWLNISNNYRPIQIIIFFLLCVLLLSVFQWTGSLHVIKFVGLELLKIIYYYPFNAHGINNDSSFIWYINNLYHLLNDSFKIYFKTDVRVITFH